MIAVSVYLTVVGPMSLQPAEFAKFATALALAKLFSSYNFTLNASPVNYIKALLITHDSSFGVFDSRDKEYDGTQCGGEHKAAHALAVQYPVYAESRYPAWCFS